MHTKPRTKISAGGYRSEDYTNTYANSSESSSIVYLIDAYIPYGSNRENPQLKAFLFLLQYLELYAPTITHNTLMFEK